MSSTDAPEMFPHVPRIKPPSTASAEAGERISKADRSKGRRMYLGLTIVLMIAALAIGGTAVSLYQQYTRWDPLGVYATQTVIDRIPGSTQPTIELSSGFVHVNGQKCNNSNEPIRVTGTKAWVLIEPPGTIIDDTAPASKDPKTGKLISAPMRIPGCTVKDYENPIPDGVADRVRELARQGRFDSIWAITGNETPEDDDGTTGVRRSWTTTNFTIHYDGPIPVPAD